MEAAHLDRQPEPVKLPRPAGAASAIELRHLRYFVALSDAGSFTRAAEGMFIAQPTLSQQIRRLEEIVGAPLLQRRRDGVHLTKAGAVLLDAARAVLSLVDQEVNRTRQAAGLGRQRLRVVVPPGLPEALAVEAASMLKSAAATADVEIVWMETPLDAEFSLIRQRRADAGLGWLTDRPEALPSPLDVMALATFEPDVWIRRSAPRDDQPGRDGPYGRHPRAAARGAGDLRRLDTGAADRGSALRLHRSAAAALAADEPGLRRDRGSACGGVDRSQRHRRQPARADPATPPGGYPRDGPGGS
jgi:DNA-binding transcriptional LysR family regulator